MSLALSCILLLKASSQHSAHIPHNVDDIVKRRISQQWQNVNPQSILIFDTGECAHKGEYSYTSSSILLKSGDPLVFTPKEFFISDVLDGRQLDIHTEQPMHAGPQSTHNEKPSSWRKKVLWGLGIGLLGGLSYALINKNNEKNNLQPSLPLPTASPSPATQPPAGKVRTTGLINF